MGGDGMSNKILKKGKMVRIYLNKPPDFIYDIDDIVVEYNMETKGLEITNEQIPVSIKKNMAGFYTGDIKAYVKFLERNLEVFFRGEVPDAGTEAKPPSEEAPGSVEPRRLRPHELPKDYRFPINARCTLNVAVEMDRAGVLIVACEKLRVQVKCARCGGLQTIDRSSSCAGCTSSLDFTYVPTCNPDFLGFMSLGKCELVSFGASKYQLSCEECEAGYETPELGIGSVFALRCYECLKPMKIRILNITHIHRKKDVIKIGTELPDKGTCRHYRKSLRWFRFPCCGSLYPCDMCHDEESGHIHEMANRMVCGLCSKEQSVKKECDCGMTLRRSTAFWEGGKGNRNKASMSRKDSRKYSR
jgi:uncharacterized CHY-type Zn-finger protein